MKSSTIVKVLRNRLEGVAKTITDQEVSKLFLENAIVSGGAITSMLLNEKVNDYDLYFRTYDSALAIAKYYVSQFSNNDKARWAPVVKELTRTNIKGEEEKRIVIWMQSAGVAGAEQTEYKYFEMQPDDISQSTFMESLSPDPVAQVKDVAEFSKKHKDYAPIFFSENAITLTNKMQLVIRFTGEPNQIHDNYDFTHAKTFYDYKSNNLDMSREALECTLTKTLHYSGSLYPIASLFRIRKFIKRGWSITAGQMLKIIWQINSIDLANPKVLREQLIGVDQAYMQQLLSALESKEANQRIDTTYIANLIDTIFEEL